MFGILMSLSSILSNHSQTGVYFCRFHWACPVFLYGVLWVGWVGGALLSGDPWHPSLVEIFAIQFCKLSEIFLRFDSQLVAFIFSWCFHSLLASR